MFDGAAEMAPAGGAPGVAGAAGPEMARGGDTIASKAGTDTATTEDEPTQTRTNFVETWIWSDHTVG